MVFWSKVAHYRERLQESEQRLLDYAKQFGDRHESDYTLSTFDTPIPNADIPLQISPQEREKLSLHGIQVTSLQQDSSTSQMPLVFLHGYANASAYFYRNLVGLSRHFASVYSLDLLGWGLSSRPKFTLRNEQETSETRLTEQVFVESLEAWRVHHNIDRMILAGHSMGGYLSVAYCEHYPQHVERLILLSPVGVPHETPQVRQRLETLASSSWTRRMLFKAVSGLFACEATFGNVLRALPESKAHSMARQYVDRRLRDITDPSEQDAVTDYLFYNNALPGSGEHCFHPILNMTAHAKDPLVHRIPKLKISHVSFMYGQDDWMDPDGGLQVQALARNQPTVVNYCIRNAGHLLLLDNWKEFNAGIVLSAGLELIGEYYHNSIPPRVEPNEPHRVDCSPSETTPSTTVYTGSAVATS